MAKAAPNLQAVLGPEGEKLLEGLAFEDGLKLLEELVSKVETGSLPLESAILSYERGVALVARLRELLSGAEQKIKLLQSK